MNCLILYIHYIITKNKKFSIIRKQFNGVIGDSISYVINIYIKNNKGPSTEPCGTPQETQLTDDWIPAIHVNCCRLVK